MKIKTSEATELQLDWLVWKCTGGAAAYPKTASGAAFLKLWKGNSAKYLHPSTDWAQGGPIIEREMIAVWFHTEYGCWCAASIDWMDADVDSAEFLAMPDAFRGLTALIAAMRCFVFSRLGDEVDVPEELT